MPDLPYHALLVPFGWEHRFEVLEKIGSGAMGQVWRAREVAAGASPWNADTPTTADPSPDYRLAAAATQERIVALKMIDPARRGDEQILARLEIEGETLTKLRDAGQHEHVVPILDFKITDEHACLVMEFIPGLNLKKWCSTHQLSLQERVKLIAQVARGAGWFHGLGVVHRDLKPANILVSAITHQPVIVDFSIAKVEDELTLTLTNEALGTAPYMAPEQFDKRRGPISPATDVFALGSTLYELLTQVHPHPGDFPQIMQRLADEVRPAPPSALTPSIPRDLESIILKALSHRPADRYTDGTGFAADLDHFLAGEPVTARPISTAAYIIRQARRRPALTTTLAVCSALAVSSAWNVSRLARAQKVAALETEFGRLQQEPGGTPGVTAALDTTLAKLGQIEPVKATLLSGAAVQSAIRKSEELLRQSYVKPDALDCLEHETLPWLKTTQPQEAERLEQLLPYKRDHWDMNFTLRAPFTDHVKYLGVRDAGMEVRERHLFPADAAAVDGTPVAVKFRMGFQAPSRLALNLCPRRDVFERFRIRVEGGERILDFDLYHGSKAPPEWREMVASSTGSGTKFLLVCSRNGQPEQARVFFKPVVNGGPDRDYEHPFGMSLSILPNHVDFSMLGRGGVRMEDLFSFGNPSRPNQITLFWPLDLGLRELSSHSVKGLGRGRMMEVGDGYLLGRNLASALAVYEQAFGDPDHAFEARHKAALVHWMDGRPDPAFVLWEAVSAEQHGLWRDLSLFRLWFHTLEKHGPAAASGRLEQLTQAMGPTSPRFRQLLTTPHRLLVLERYGTLTTQASPWRVSPALATDATRAFRAVDAPAPDAAGLLALALHLKGMDEAALDLLGEKLSPVQLPASSTIPRTITLLPALDHWSRIVLSEQAPLLAQTLSAWRKSRPAAPEFRFLEDVEQARQALRQNRPEAARHLLEPPELWERVALRVLLPGRLTQAAMHHLDGKAALAQEEGRKAIDAHRHTHELTSAERLDLAVLSVLSRAWTAESTRTLLGPFFSSAAGEADIPTLDAALHSGVLGSARLVQVLNTLIDTSEIAQLVRHHAFRRLNARQLYHKWGAVFMKCLIVSCLDPAIAESSDTRVREIAETLMQSWADFTQSRPPLDTILIHFIHAPESPPALTLPPALSPLAGDLHWLLTCRYQHLGRKATPPAFSKPAR